MKKVLITPRSFGKYNREELVEILKKNDIEPVFNPYGTILTEQQMTELMADMDGLIVGVDPVTKNVIQAAPNLKVISKYGVGVDNIDIPYTKQQEIPVYRTVGANSNAVADYAFGLLMAVSRRIVEIDHGCHHNDWSKKEALDIYGKKIGILGLGAIGKGMVKRARGFDMEVYGYDVFKDEEFIKEYDVHFTDVDTIIKECDFISLHLPLLDSTKHILNEKNLANAKPNLIIINTARGGLLDETTAYKLLKEQKIYGLGVDVFEHEPAETSPLLECPNVVVGSHTAASTKNAIEQMSLMAVENVLKELKEGRK